MPNDTQQPTLMPRGEYERRALATINEALAAQGAVPDRLRYGEFCTLFGADLGPRMASALETPPYVCPCGELYRSSLGATACPSCVAKARDAAYRASIEVDIRAAMAQETGKQ